MISVSDISKNDKKHPSSSDARIVSAPSFRRRLLAFCTLRRASPKFPVSTRSSLCRVDCRKTQSLSSSASRVDTLLARVWTRDSRIAAAVFHLHSWCRIARKSWFRTFQSRKCPTRRLCFSPKITFEVLQNFWKFWNVFKVLKKVFKIWRSF